ncbi:hypothetical protein LOTGIDRAFT_229410 [Lottia gigantea]|uniref:Death domain-containing protein n=1 Tax=Lottia gigantea TaxID=225164 RepID=V3Z420_LOTGI|nr:hypothetical protein LOTGIDRAFT_229410 [Lottia gigantea]ESO85383.1 hypothetical protein LOTGIDRAFT_229410 [Lottia gigantea]
MDNLSQSKRNVPNLEAMDLDINSTDCDTSIISTSSIDHLNTSPGMSTFFTSFEEQMNLSENQQDSVQKSSVALSGKIGFLQSISHKSSTSSKKRLSSEHSGCQVNIYDMRNNTFSNGEIINLDVQEQLAIHRIAQFYDFPESCLIPMQYGISGERNPCVVAIREDSSDLTLFLRWESGFVIGRICVTVKNNATPQSLAVDLDRKLNYKETYEKYSPYCFHQKLDSFKNLKEQGVVSGNELIFREIRPITLKCLYRSSPTVDAIYYVNSLTTDTIGDVKLKVFNTMKKEPSSDEIRSLSSPEHIWLTSGNRLYDRDREYIGSPAPSDINNISSGLLGIVDVVINVQSSNCLPVNVLHTEFDGLQKIVISTSMSTAELRYKISTIFHCSPNALKIAIDNKRVTEMSRISNFQGLKRNCMIIASIRQAITINIELEDKTYQVSVMKLDPVLCVKQKLSELTQYETKHIKLIFEDKEPNDHHQIEKAHLKNGSEVHAIHLPKRISVCIRKNGKDPVHLIIDDSQKITPKLLKCFYTDTIRLKPKYYINYHTFGKSLQFVDSKSLDSQGIEDGCKLYATESLNIHKKGKLMNIFDYREDGQIHIINGTIINGNLLKGMDGSVESDNSSEFDSLEKQKEIPGIRLAYPEEVAAFSSNSDDSCDNGNLSNALVKLRMPTPGALVTGNYSSSAIESPAWFPMVKSPFQPHTTITPKLEHISLMSHSITEPILGELPGVVSDKELDKLVSELPGTVWQSFMRQLLPDAEITKQIESHKGNVSEQIFQCLQKWKQREGSKATIKVLQDALKSQELNLISIKIFGMEVQSD